MKRWLRLIIMLLAVGVITGCSKSGQVIDVTTITSLPPTIAPTIVTAMAIAPTSTALPTSLPTPTPLPPTSPPIPHLDGKIAYSYEGDIYVMNADGSEITRLTTDPAEDFDPSWSPDGAQIAFRSHRDGNEEVYVMNADGSDQHNVSNAPGGDYSPAWSPDGEWIAFMSDRDGQPNVWLMRPDGADLRQVTDLSGISEYPSWSPDSRRIAFHCTFGRVLPSGVGDFEICVVNADGTELVQLTDAPGESKLPAWSPDGATIAFQSNRDGWPTLPDYTPPGYDPEQFGDYEIYTMNEDGSAQVNISQHPEADDAFPAWSRDGQLIFSRYGCLIVMAGDGSEARQISKEGCAGEDSGQFPDWWQGGS